MLYLLLVTWWSLLDVPEEVVKVSFDGRGEVVDVRVSSRWWGPSGSRRHWLGLGGELARRDVARFIFVGEVFPEFHSSVECECVLA